MNAANCRLPVLAAVLCLLPALAGANNLVITNVTIDNVTNGTADVVFDLSWDNSWRTNWTDNGETVTVTNWDAAWVFAKFRRSGQLWKHVMLTESGHVATGGTVIEVPDDDGTRLGAFVYRAATGAGAVTCAAMSLKWDFWASGLAGTNEVDVSVMGIEMVCVPQGTFSLGSGGTEQDHFFEYPDTATPYVVSSEGAITVGTNAGNLYYGTWGTLEGDIPAEYPKGYQAFYCMKYEITQGQYRDFLTFLDPGIAQGYFPSNYGNYRHTLDFTNGAFRVETPDRACNFLFGKWIMNYFDWCGLRPMTELEFEKACRGVRAPWINEFAWGNTSYIAQTGHDGDDGSGTETAMPTNANILIGSSILGPVRVGIYATDSSSREQAGAGYYGVMNLSGNLMEMVINVAHAAGRGFEDEYGDGSEYTALPSSWPLPGMMSDGVGARGGGVNQVIGTARTSDRTTAGMTSSYNNKNPDRGGRGVRTAP